VDDGAQTTLAYVTTSVKANQTGKKNYCNTATAKQLGAELAGKAVAKGIESVVFDRGGYPYHGIVKAFADAAREAGLKF
jgi:large subunit ribosomal protein L18